MARGPDGITYAPDLVRDEEALNRLEFDFTSGLEKIIDRAMDTHRWGDAFVYGIHQAISPRMAEVLARRYQEAGWAEVLIREGATGAFMVVLQPAARPSPARGANREQTSPD